MNLAQNKPPQLNLKPYNEKHRLFYDTIKILSLFSLAILVEIQEHITHNSNSIDVLVVENKVSLGSQLHLIIKIPHINLTQIQFSIFMPNNTNNPTILTQSKNIPYKSITELQTNMLNIADDIKKQLSTYVNIVNK